MSDNRKYSRIGFKIDCIFKTPEVEIKCRIINLSLKGLLAEIDPLHGIDIKKGVIEMKLQCSDIVLTFDAQLVHLDGNQAGFRFISTDTESLTHLRAILEANTGDPNKIGDELHSFVKGE